MVMDILHRNAARLTIRLAALATLTLALLTPATPQQLAQEIRWLRVGNLHSWFSSLGAEREVGRTGRAEEQNDGLRWPAQFQNQNNVAGKAMWIGTTDYFDRVLNRQIPFKVIAVGTREADPVGEIIPRQFKMLGRFRAPSVSVDGEAATDNRLNDVVDEVDPTLPADRMIVNVLDSYLGLTITRRMMAHSQHMNDNYFIYEYTFKNTGIIDQQGTVAPVTLTGVVVYFQYRYAHGNEAFKLGWAPSNNIDWGRNSENQVIGTNPGAPGFDLRAQYSWYGKHSASPHDDIGLPAYTIDGHLSAVQFVGTSTLHADRSPQDAADDPAQPSTTYYIGSDTGPQRNDQFDPLQMQKKYEAMTRGHASPSHADAIGAGFADQFGADAGGYAQGQGFGPYTLAPGDSVRIVLAEAVAGLSREKAYDIGAQWLANTGPFVLPGGGSTTDRAAFKDAWVMTGQDSIQQAFRRARTAFQNAYAVTPPPPPPKIFTVNSGGDRISLSWTADDAEGASPGFDGYEVWRAIGKPDTFYTKIFECDRGTLVRAFDDTSAQRGFNYYYYVVSKDDGSRSNGVKLTSSKFYTMTNKPAYLRRPAQDSPDLSDIRVVPNPFDIRARTAQFGNEAPDRIAFWGLPPICTIRIYTERGDLVTTLEHTNGSGDELWDSTTMFRQIIVSGIYIAVFETPDGRSAIRKFIVIR
jgi:hypothetical protein